MKIRPKVIVAEYNGAWNVIRVNHRGEVTSGSLYGSRRVAMRDARISARAMRCKVSVV